MLSESRKNEVAKFPLRLMSSVRRTAELYSAREGVSLNQFINVAVAEKLAHLEHEEWVRNRKQLGEALIGRALEVMDRPGGVRAEPGDELPEGYTRAKE